MDIECVVCGRPIYISPDKPSICGECEICPACASQQVLVQSEEHEVFECEFCEHKFPSKKDLEQDVRNYWTKRARCILGLE